MIEAYMNATLDVLRLAGQMFLQRIDYELRRFGEDLLDFINDLDRNPRRDWRERFDAFLADQTARGREITPESRKELIAYLEMWERNVFGGPPEPKPVPQAVITRVKEPIQVSRTAGRIPQIVPPRKSSVRKLRRSDMYRPPAEREFYQKLAEARRLLAEMARAVGLFAQKLDAAEDGESIEVDADLDAIENLIWTHNDVLESARDLWLREDLEGDTYNQLAIMSDPTSVGLPRFVDDDQPRRAKAQRERISARVDQRIAFLDDVIFAMEVIEKIGTAASFLMVGGILFQAAKQGGKVLLVKTVAKMAASTAAGAVAGKATGNVLKTAGLDDEQVAQVQGAVDIISAVLQLRRMGRLKQLQTTHNQKTVERQAASVQSAQPKRLLALPAPNTARLPQDLKVNPVPPRALSTKRSIGGGRMQWRALQADIKRARSEGARDIRVNQEQVNAAGQRVGTNRPDLQYTRADGTRVYIEYDNVEPKSFPNSPRGPGHAARILANDPRGVIELRSFP